MSLPNKQEKISIDDDYFRMNASFSIWLIKKKKTKFEDLENKKSLKLFKKFTKKWNKGKLDEIFYDEKQLIMKYGGGVQTAHQWGLNLDDKDQINLTDCLYDLKKNKNDEKLIQDSKKQEPVKKTIGPTMPPIKQ